MLQYNLLILQKDELWQAAGGDVVEGTQSCMPLSEDIECKESPTGT